MYQILPNSGFLVEGNYIGNNGLVNFKGYLEGDSSPVDKLIVRGSTSGTSRVVVTNLSLADSD
ncbi:autotransporter outer membrane beta-barrel domain-containing protein [Alistipes shahii]|uniref:Autotransporter outer membrane beta-barrel domain-containing protein n=1 Tax=Alistipes shahii TaxID=328814 RepID=A0A5B3FNY7_9BACT|nr:autotransporter outer membrane beta-barrel domain-containing protein [Alistipes shahii]